MSKNKQHMALEDQFGSEEDLKKMMKEMGLDESSSDKSDEVKVNEVSYNNEFEKKRDIYMCLQQDCMSQKKGSH